LIISIVKSSLALSLGLVGALSIVRFRAAIKEPEELVWLFLAISVGLGLGANQASVTVVALIVILAIVALRHLLLFRRRPEQPNLYLTVTTAAPQKLTSTQVLEALTEVGATASLKRFDETQEQTEVSLRVSFKDVAKLEEFNHQLRELSSGVKLSYHDDHGLSA